MESKCLGRVSENRLRTVAGAEKTAEKQGKGIEGEKETIIQNTLNESLNRLINMILINKLESGELAIDWGVTIMKCQINKPAPLES